MGLLVMPVIIDGNNFLHAPKPGSLAGLDELGLCRALARTHWRGEGVRIVCDGEPGTLGRLTSPVDGIELLYSGAKRSADAVIEQLINEDTAPRRLLVVSSDRAVRRAGQRRRARAWTSEHFARELVRALAARRHDASDPGAASDATLPPSQVQHWLEMFGYDSSEQAEQGEQHGTGSADPANEDESRYWPPW